MQHSFIIFTISNNRYAIELAKTCRILQAKKLKRIPNSSKIIDGLLSFEETVIKVLNLRTALKIHSFEDEIREKLEKAKKYHIYFFNELINSIRHNNSEFKLELNSNRCHVGKFITSFNIPDMINDSFKEFKYFHSKFHNLATYILKNHSNQENQLERLESELTPLFNDLLNHFEIFKLDINKIANHMQKYIIYRNENYLFAIKVDEIIDIVTIQNSEIKDADNKSVLNGLTTIKGVFESEHKLVTIIEKFHIKELK